MEGIYVAWDRPPDKHGGAELARGTWAEVLAAVAARLLNGEHVTLCRLDAPE